MHYVVTYTANSNDEHWADPVYHTNKFERIFKEEVDALHFLGQCRRGYLSYRDLTTNTKLS